MALDLHGAAPKLQLEACLSYQTRSLPGEENAMMGLSFQRMKPRYVGLGLPTLGSWACCLPRRESIGGDTNLY